MHLEHALHNESLCDHLIEEQQWNDWVVTTAFYAALHFTEAALFPLTEGDTTYANFDEYYPNRGLYRDFTPDKHSSRVKLVWRRMKKAGSAYQWLRENCYTARYNSYQVEGDAPSNARIKLSVVKGYCEPMARAKVTS